MKSWEFRFLTGRFEDYDPGERYSCVHMSHIIEHVPNPNVWMKKAASLLVPGGVLVLCVPNMGSLTRKIKLLLKKAGLRKGRWKDAKRTPDHLFEPTVKGMRFFIRKNGFTLLKMYSYSRSNMISGGVNAFVFHHALTLGSNLRIYARPPHG